MKRIYLILALLVASASASAQIVQNPPIKPYTKEGNTFIQSALVLPAKGDQITNYYWQDTKSNKYPIILHTYKAGANKGKTTAYVILKSEATGREYKYYLPNGMEIAEEILKENAK